MDWTLEVVNVPVTDVDRAVSFYRDKVGFNLDHDAQMSDEMRVVQLTPPGSSCSIVLGVGVTESEPGSAQAQLIVSDLEKARAELIKRGVEVSDITRFNPDDGGAFAFFSDPDGNKWAVQEIRSRGKA